MYVQKYVNLLVIFNTSGMIPIKMFIKYIQKYTIMYSKLHFIDYS